MSETTKLFVGANPGDKFLTRHGRVAQYIRCLNTDINELYHTICYPDGIIIEVRDDGKLMSEWQLFVGGIGYERKTAQKISRRMGQFQYGL